MDDNLTPSKPEGSGTFRMATWNIVDGRGERLSQAAAGLAQIRVGLAVLTETETRRRQTPQNRLRVCYHVLKGSERAPRGCRALVEGGRPKI